MTIPIVPSPWDFLRTGGEAFFQAKQQAEERARIQAAEKRMNDLQNIQLFSQLLPFMQPTQTPGMSIPGSPLTRGMPISGPPTEQFDVPPTVAESFRSLTGGVPTLRRSASMRANEAQAKVAENTTQAQIRTANAGATQAESQAALSEAEIEGLVNELRQMTPEQIRTRANIPGAAVARLREELEFEKTQTELLGQESTRQEFQIKKAIQDGILRDLPKDANFRRVAEFAAIGGIGYLIAGIQNRSETDRLRIAQNRDQLQMLNSIETTARQAWTQAIDDYRTQQNRAIESATSWMPEGSEKQKLKKEEARNSAIANFRSVNPEPTYDKIVDVILNTHNITREAYNEAFKMLVKLETSGTPTSTTTTRTTTKTEPASSAPPQPSAQKSEEDMLREALASTTDPAAQKRMKELYKQRTGKEPPL